MAATSTPILTDLGTGTHRFSLGEYHQLTEIGVLDDQESLELLDGYICHKGGRRPSTLRPVPHPNWTCLWRFTVPEYHAMIEAGILTADDRIELIDGYLVQKMSRNPPHGSALDLFRAAFPPFVQPGTMLRSQQAVTLLESAPEPDFALVLGGPRTYPRRHPRPSDILLVVEVSDATLASDRGPKLRAYARNRLPIYWIVNLVDGQIEVYTDPDPAAVPPTYTAHVVYAPGQAVPVVLSGQRVGSIPVNDLLP